MTDEQIEERILFALAEFSDGFSDGHYDNPRRGTRYWCNEEPTDYYHKGYDAGHTTYQETRYDD